MLGRVLVDILRKLVEVGLSLGRLHRHRLMNGIGGGVNVPRVDDERSVERLSGAGKLRKNHGSVTFRLGGDVLVRDLMRQMTEMQQMLIKMGHEGSGLLSTASTSTHEVHSVSGGGDQAGVRNGVHGRELLEWHRLVHKVDWHELHSTESAIDSTDELIDRRSKVLVLLDILSRRNSQLDENDLIERSANKRSSRV